jgi:rubrerythrin
MMAITYSAGEVFEIGVQIERNGARFYGRAAERLDDPAVCGLLEDLARMEEAHERVFRAMRRELADREQPETMFDPNAEAGEYLRAVAGGKVFDLRVDPTDWLEEGERSRQDVLRKAIQVEKDSIIYYLGIKEAVPEGLGRERIDGIIRQEMTHLSLLGTTLESAAGSSN